MHKELQALHMPRDIADILDNLELTIGQVAKLGGVTSRQVSYWTEKGVISAKREPGRAQYYDLDAVRKVRLVKELLDCGYTLATAAEEAERIMLAEGTGRGETITASPRAGDGSPIARDEGRTYMAGLAPQDLRERLEGLEARIRHLETLLKGAGIPSPRAEGISRARRSDI
ncbi:MAG: MerR family transcriptional regulator [Firmicutes bacterium]|nr:MerR family transcriptional regulator [Bacillota bacterium]